jgi:hypothetical protein
MNYQELTDSYHDFARMLKTQGIYSERKYKEIEESIIPYSRAEKFLEFKVK